MMIHRIGRPSLIAIFIILLIPFTAPLGNEEGKAIPHLGKKGNNGFQSYQFADDHRAFAIAPGGSWAWTAEQPDVETARRVALKNCARYTPQKCTLYAVNDNIVFDRQLWAGLWGPYKPKQEAATATVGTALGQRFHNLRLKTPDGKTVTLNKLKGRVVLLHFWGSWCPPCCRELPKLEELYRQLKQQKLAVEMLLIPVREKADVSKKWLKEQGLNLPVYDGGAHDKEGGEQLELADGSSLNDRELAKMFPSTTVIDKHGIVVFAKRGPAREWSEYLPFLKDAAERSGK